MKSCCKEIMIIMFLYNSKNLPQCYIAGLPLVQRHITVSAVLTQEEIPRKADKKTKKTAKIIKEEYYDRILLLQKPNADQEHHQYQCQILPSIRWLFDWSTLYVLFEFLVFMLQYVRISLNQVNSHRYYHPFIHSPPLIYFKLKIKID